MRVVISEKEKRHAPEDRKSIPCKSLYLVEKYFPVIKIMTRTIVTALMRFVNSGDRRFLKEGRTFVSGDVRLWFMDRLSNR